MKISKKVPHIWLIDFEELSREILTFQHRLSKDELKRAKQYRFVKDQIAFVLTRGALRFLLANYLDLSSQEIVFSYSQFGKPELQSPSTEVHFNVSHTNNFGLLGFSSHAPIGVDIEQMSNTSDLDDIVERFFSPGEVRDYRFLNISDRVQGFYNCWTRKESVIKAIGHGLSFPLDQFDVSLRPGEPAQLLTLHNRAEESKKWSLRSIEVPEGYTAALAVQEEIEDVQFNKFTLDHF